MGWTESQKKAIDSDEKNIIVSAAAGSGKTGVLTERVIRLVKKKNDIGRMLIMTFTNAAAGEMKKRITKALLDAATQAQKENPNGAEYLFEQAELADRAHISTFHSFCIELLRENFNIADISPNFKILSDSEENALRHEAMRDVLDGLYANRDEDLIRLLARYTTKYNETDLIYMLLDIYDKARSRPGLFKWITNGAELGKPISVEERVSTLLEIYTQNMMENLTLAIENMGRAVALETEFNAEHNKKQSNRIEDLILLERALKSDAIYAYALINSIKFTNAPRKSDKYSQDEIDIIMSIKDFIAQAKDFAAKSISWGDPSLIKEEVRHTYKDAAAIAEIIEKFDALYAEKKKERNRLDFDDTLIKTIDVLEQNPDIALKFDYIFVDEYQDTNPVQDRIIDLLKRDNPDINLFLVGDMKQSVYKFRNADPRAFKGKADNYKNDKERGKLITMNKNFRSDSAVIDAVNGVMENLMSLEFGEIEYGEGERLIGNSTGGKVELLIGEYDKDAKAADSMTDAELKADIEAQAVVDSIERTLTERKADGTTFNPTDIAILARKLKNNDVIKAIMKKLRQKGILYSVKNHKSTDTPEIELFVNLLKIIDNPKNDLSLVSVLKSDIGGFDDNLLAEIRVFADYEKSKDIKDRNLKGNSFYDYLKSYAEFNKDTPKGEKAANFIKLLGELQLESVAESLWDFVNTLRDRFDFDYSYTFIKNGNLKRDLFEKFIQYIGEICDYSGNNLYKLICELDAEKKREGSYINIQADDNIPAVSIMTMHKSKGLEFPSVYLVGLNKDLSKGNFNNSYVADSESGLILPYHNEKTRAKRDGVALSIVKEKMKKEEKSELLRLLYVAMTRAKERLYLSGVIDKNKKEEEPYLNQDIDFKKSDKMLDWLISAKPQKYGVEITDIVETYHSQEEEKAKDAFNIEDRIAALAEKEGGADIITPAPFDTVPQKVSVSEIRTLDISGEKNYKYKPIRGYLKAIAEDNDEAQIKGAALGTLIHKVMEYIAKHNLDTEQAAQKMLENNLISQREYDAVIKNKFMADGFLNSDIYKRMREADKTLEEQRFLLNVPARDLGFDSNEPVTVQGVFDAAFLENDAWVLIDYKTDDVKAGDLKGKAETYKVQIDIYSDALEKITGKPVSERYLYFLRPGELYAV